MLNRLIDLIDSILHGVLTSAGYLHDRLPQPPVEMFCQIDRLAQPHIGFASSVRGMHLAVDIFAKFFDGFGVTIQRWMPMHVVSEIAEDFKR